ncbi:facilitated trehalose transporter Tret1-like [Danaus plexippus]|uniref:facilitated trehalose transporter Tret1-like n=1 Tax=Danaus plexippus TaxID=13037 RepID=UPI002AB0B38A|nr:facilitated trehalose transporter Tret1-like [Danaus plexippus]
MKIVLSPVVVRQYLIATVVNFGSLTTGISLFWASPMLVKLRNGTDTPLSRPITEEEGSWIVSGGYLAAVGTTLLGGILIDKIGRKYCIILVTIPRICASIWTIFVTEVWMLILCRTVMIFTDSFIFIVVPMYVSEIASKEHRGALGTFLHIVSCLGIVITLGVGPFLSYVELNAFLAITIIVTFLPVPFLPDSPIYLYSKGRIDEAINVLSKVRESDAIIKQELEDYRSSKQIKVNKMALIRDRTFLKSLSLGILVCAGANMIGYSAISFYLQTIFESTNTSVAPEIASLVIGCIQLLAALCTTIFTKIFGRRPILIYSLLGMFVGMLGLGIFFTFSTKEGYVITGFLNYLPIISMILCTYNFNVGIGCLLLVVTAELFDGTARAFGYSICLTSSLFLAFLSSKYFVQFTSVLGPSATYWFFSAMCLLVCILIALFLPETKGKTFNEIQVSLGSQRLVDEPGTSQIQKF